MGVAVLKRQLPSAGLNGVVELNGVKVRYNQAKPPKAIEPRVFSSRIILVIGDQANRIPLMTELIAQVIDAERIDLVEAARTFFRQDQPASARIHQVVRSGGPIPPELIARPLRESLKGLEATPRKIGVYTNFPQTHLQFKALQAERFDQPPLYLDFRAQGSPRDPSLRRVRKALAGQKGHYMIDYLDAGSALASAVAVLEAVDLIPPTPFSD
jgi:hypothetical protein